MKNRKIALYNPLLQDFSIRYDVNGNGSPITFTIKSLEIRQFSGYLAEHVKKHLANAVLNERGPKNGNVEERLKEINKEIVVG